MLRRARSLSLHPPNRTVSDAKTATVSRSTLTTLRAHDRRQQKTYNQFPFDQKPEGLWLSRSNIVTSGRRLQPRKHEPKRRGLEQTCCATWTRVPRRLATMRPSLPNSPRGEKWYAR